MGEWRFTCESWAGMRPALPSASCNLCNIMAKQLDRLCGVGLLSATPLDTKSIGSMCTIFAQSVCAKSSGSLILGNRYVVIKVSMVYIIKVALISEGPLSLAFVSFVGRESFVVCGGNMQVILTKLSHAWSIMTMQPSAPRTAFSLSRQF